MKKQGYNNTYTGNLLFKDQKEKVLFHKLGSYCSQAMWEYPTLVTGVDHICFVFPTDWCISGNRHDLFMHRFCEIGSKMFDIRITYKGRTTWKEFGIKYDSFQNIRNRTSAYWYDGENPSKKSYEENRGDLIANDDWMEFRFDVADFKGTKNMRSYAAYCFIRYLFCDSYHSLIKDFLHIMRTRVYYIDKEVDDFTIFQIAHHIDLEYSHSWGFLPALPEERYIPKLVSKDRFLKFLDNGRKLQESFSCGEPSNLKRVECDKLTRLVKIKEIYERLKIA